MNKFLEKSFVPFTFIFMLSISSCKFGLYQFLFNEESVESRADEIKILQADQIPSFTESKYSFALFTDAHVGSEDFGKCDDKFLAWISKQFENPDETKRPKFLVSLGDNMHTGREDSKYNSFPDRIKELAQEKNGVSNFKTYSIMGNHDLYNNGWERFKSNIFPYTSSYCFTDGTFSYYFLDDANNTFGQSQRDAMESAFKQDAKPKIIFIHCPIYIDARDLLSIIFKLQDTMERNWILTLFAKNNVKQIFSGHVHSRFKTDYGKFREDALGNFGKEYWYLVTVDRTNKTVTLSKN